MSSKLLSPTWAFPAPQSVFVTGTDTGVGKTVISALLVKAWGADYWKPIQSGLVEGADAETIREAAPEAVIHPSAYCFQAPLSPHEAARLEGVTIALEAFQLPKTSRPLVAEGAGGVLVPLNERVLMIDLIVRLGLPVIVVARSGLGTINHTLLTIEALARRDVKVLGIVMNGPANLTNRQAVEFYSGRPVLAEVLWEQKSSKNDPGSAFPIA
ncbi:ATP-dependent dethiobiotin synthetase BioD [Azospirillaceae bacterium]